MVAAFTVLVIAATVWGVRARPADLAPTPGRLIFHPFAQFLLVCVLLLVNQLLCAAYIDSVHGGDASFVTKYLGDGWFDTVHVELRVGEWAAVSVLRVQAFLELPFTLFAYLSVARMLGRSALPRRASIVAASVAFTAAFSIVEVWLANPWTLDDLVLRAISMVVAPLWVIATMSRAGTPADRPATLTALLAFLAGAAAIAYLVLAMYDSTLLYNLAHLPRYLIGGAIAIAVAIAASWFVARRRDSTTTSVDLAGRPGAMRFAHDALARFTVAFFVPSLAIRYFGGHAIAELCGFVLVAMCVVTAGQRAFARVAVGGAPMTIPFAAATIAAPFASLGAVVAIGPQDVPERTLAVAAIAFLVGALVAMAAAERYQRSSRAM